MSVRRNAVINVVGNVLPGLIGLVLLPQLISRLGLELFGVFSLVITIIGYSSIFDFGVSRAITLAISVAKSDDHGRERAMVAQAGIVITLGMGIIGALLLLLLSVPIAHLMSVKEGGLRPAVAAIRFCALALPVTTVTMCVRGVMEGYENFLASNLLKALQGIGAFTLPLIFVLAFGSTVQAATLGLVVNRFLFLPLHFFLAKKTGIGLWRNSLEFVARIKELTVTGGWMTVSNVISPILATSDRFFISSMLGSMYVSIYTVPLDAMQRFLLVPAAISNALFPRLSKQYSDRSGRLNIALAHMVNMACLSVPLLVALLFGKEVLSLWISEDFAVKASTVLKIISVGIFLNGVANIPFAQLQAAGKSNQTAMLHILECLVYIPALIALVKLLGVQGAAIAWTLRCGLDCVILLYRSRVIEQHRDAHA